MNLVFLGIIIFIILVLILSWFAKASTQKISKNIRFLIVLFSLILGILLIFAGRILLAAPLLVLLLPLIKLKSGFSLFKAIMLFRLINRLRQQGRFSYSSGTNFSPGSSSITLNEAYNILDCKKGDPKEKIESNYKKLMLKLHPDLNKDIDSTKISQILTEARNLIIKTDFN
jgi:hypothetical protein|tara:strand:- start:17 stop:532 length:516 start_codon:yes stop_codon:yes gene_type:complete